MSRFGKVAGAANAGAASLCAELIWLGSVLVAFGAVISMFTGMSLTMAIAIACVVTCVYTYLGGMWAASLWGRNIQLAIRPNATDKQMLSWIRAMVPVAILVAALIALLAQTIYWLICMAYALTLVVLFVLRCSRAVSLAALALIFSLFAVMVSLAINCLIG